MTCLAGKLTGCSFWRNRIGERHASCRFSFRVGPLHGIVKTNVITQRPLFMASINVRIDDELKARAYRELEKLE